MEKTSRQLYDEWKEKIKMPESFRCKKELIDYIEKNKDKEKKNGRSKKADG